MTKETLSERVDRALRDADRAIIRKGLDKKPFIIKERLAKGGDWRKTSWSKK